MLENLKMLLLTLLVKCVRGTIQTAVKFRAWCIQTSSNEHTCKAECPTSTNTTWRG